MITEACCEAAGGTYKGNDTQCHGDNNNNNQDDLCEASSGGNGTGDDDTDNDTTGQDGSFDLWQLCGMIFNLFAVPGMLLGWGVMKFRGSRTRRRG